MPSSPPKVLNAAPKKKKKNRRARIFSLQHGRKLSEAPAAIREYDVKLIQGRTKMWSESENSFVASKRKEPLPSSLLSGYLSLFDLSRA